MKAKSMVRLVVCVLAGIYSVYVNLKQIVSLFSAAPFSQLH